MLQQASIKRHDMSTLPMYPLPFEPIYQYRLWGGRRLSELLTAPLPGTGPIGEAWLLSDRWDRVDPRTGKPRPLQVEQAVACIDFRQVAIGPVAPVVLEDAPVRRERLFHCAHFSVWRHTGQSPFTVGAAGTPRVLVCIAGEGELEHSGTNYPVGRGDVVLLPAEVGACSYRPHTPVAMLEVALPG